MFVTNACHPSLKIRFLNKGLLIQQVLLFPQVLSDILFQLSLQNANKKRLKRMWNHET